jgi:hypothetical protein
MMELMNLSLPPEFAKYLGILGLLLLWKVRGRKPTTSNRVRAASPALPGPRHRALRHAVVLPAELSWDHDIGKGLTKNISVQGCRVKIDLTPPVETYVSVKLSLQGDECIAIELAVIRWVLGEDLGLEFLSMSAIERQRLQNLLSLERQATKVGSLSTSKGP